MGDIENPVTMEEWSLYIQSIPAGDDLEEIAYAANSLNFVQQLLSEGYDAEDVEGILRLFAMRLQAEGMFVPDNGAGFYVSYISLLGNH